MIEQNDVVPRRERLSVDVVLNKTDELLVNKLCDNGCAPCEARCGGAH